MNRTIKFRVWSGKAFLFSYKGMGLSFSGSRKDSEMEAFGCYDLEQCLDFGFVIQQFTGLKDKNDREIYEGDILGIEAWNRDNTISEVIYCNKTLGFKIKRKDNLIFDNFPSCQYLEIVGNIFETPELLKT